MLAILMMPGYLLRRAHQQSTAVFTERMNELGYDITSVQFAALCVICKFPGLGQAALADIVAYDRATIVGVIDRLEAKGLISRTISTADRRARVLMPTSRGRETLEEVMPFVVALQDDILGRLAEDEKQNFVTLLNRMLDIQPIDEGDECPGASDAPSVEGS